MIPMKNRLPLIARIGLWSAFACALLVAVGGFLHTSAGRPWLARLGIGCPARAGTAEEVDRARTFGAARYAGHPEAPARPALGFTFEATTLDQFEAWAKKFDLSCDTIRRTPNLRRCVDVPSTALGQPEWFGTTEEVTFAFRKDRTLASVGTMRRKLTVEHANAMTNELRARLHATLGPPTVTAGENHPAHFSKGPLQAFKDEWVFGDYGATLSEVRLADTGIMVRERYVSPIL